MTLWLFTELISIPLLYLESRLLHLIQWFPKWAVPPPLGGEAEMGGWGNRRPSYK